MRDQRQIARLPLCAAVTTILLFGAACSSQEPSADAEPANPERAPVNVTAVLLEPQGLTERIELAGELQPWVEVRVSTELGGTVGQVGFDQGDRVEAGQVLARVGSDLHQAALDEAEAGRVEAEALHTKTQKLFEREGVPRQELIRATAALQVAEARVNLARLRLGRSVVRAPISGFAVTRQLEPGEVLSPGAPITTLHRVDRVKAVAGVPENDISALRVGGEANVRVDAYPDREFEGRIKFLGPATEGPSRTFPVEVALDNRGGELRPGMIARVALVKRSYEDVIVVDRDSLQERDAGSVAVVLDGDVARVRDVVLGPAEGNRVLVRDGLESGEWLIVSGHRALVDGQRVNVVKGQQ
jgi:membrane fusion protein (multidrug efflux system)